MADRVTGDRVEKTPRRELDRKDFDAVLVGGVLTDARAPVRDGGVVQRSQGAAGGGGPASSLRMLEADGDPDVSNVRVILVPNDKLTDNGAGNVSLDIPPNLTLENATVVNTNVSKINISEDSLTLVGGGEVTIELGPKTYIQGSEPAEESATRINLWEQSTTGHLWHRNPSQGWQDLSGWA